VKVFVCRDDDGHRGGKARIEWLEMIRKNFSTVSGLLFALLVKLYLEPQVELVFLLVRPGNSAA
jgi:hypothetical protein